MRPPRTYRVEVSDHARLRARERFPGYKAARISDEVRLALQAGRVSPTKPPGVSNADAPGCLYAWTLDGLRVFALKLNRHDDGESFVVATVMAADPEAVAC